MTKTQTKRLLKTKYALLKGKYRKRCRADHQDNNPFYLKEDKDFFSEDFHSDAQIDILQTVSYSQSTVDGRLNC